MTLRAFSLNIPSVIRYMQEMKFYDTAYKLALRASPAWSPVNNAEIKNIGSTGHPDFILWITVKAIIKTSCFFDIAK